MSTHLVSINPDLRSSAGHGLYLDRELAREAAVAGWHFHSLGHEDLPASLRDEHPWLEGIFRDICHQPTNHDAGHRDRFFCDLSRWCNAPRRRDADLVLFIYTGHVCQLPALWRLLEQSGPELRVVFNLYAAHWDFDEESDSFQFLRDTLGRILGPGAHLAERRRFVLTSDSAILARLAEEWWGAEVPVLPFFSMARSRHAAPGEPAPPAVQTQPVTIVYPSSVHRQRGFDAFPSMVEHCRLHGGQDLRFVFRTCIDEHVLSSSEREVCARLQALGAELVYGSLSEEQMARFYSGADIVLNPYPRRYFKDRTSGNVADALAFGKALVATRGTWSGDLIERLGCGESFEDGDGASMGRAVLKVVGNLPAYTAQARSQGALWARENNVAMLLRRIQELAANPPAPMPAAPAAERWRELVFKAIDAATCPPPEPPPPPPPPAATEAAAPVAPIAPPAPPARSHFWDPALRKLERRLARLQFENDRMRRTIEHFRASPIRALRLWYHRKQRRLWR